MSETVFKKWEFQSDKLTFFVAEDEALILNIFQECLKAEGEILSESDFSLSLKDSSDNLHIAIMDGTLSGVDWDDTSLNDWLEYHDITSDLNNSLLIIGFSGDTRNITDKCFKWYLKGAVPRMSINVLVDLCLKTANKEVKYEEWPSSLPNPISDLIHTLDNFLIPLRLDSETLKEVLMSSEPNKEDILKETYKEIWTDHFGRGGTGYLGKFSKQHNGSDAVSFVYAITRELGNVSALNAFDKFKHAVDKLRIANLIMDYNISAAEQLQDGLRMITEYGQFIVEILRDIRINQNTEV